MQTTASDPTAHAPEGVEAGYCPRFQQAVELIGRRWTGAILLVMFGGTSRYSDIRDGVPGLSDRLLSERLRELELAGIVERSVAPDVPVVIRYRLTEKGRSLAPVVGSLHSWVARWAEPADSGPAGAAEPGAGVVGSPEAVPPTGV